MSEKYVIFSLEDEKAKVLGEAISNPTCKKIVNFLAEKEASASDISKEFRIPLNSVDYNLKKLIGAGIIEKTKGFLWSVKGKKIESYRVVNKVIVISPKRTNVYSKLKGIVPAIIISAILTAIVGWYYNSVSFAQKAAEEIAQTPLMTAAPGAANAAMKFAEPSILGYSAPWIWFAAGGIIAIVLVVIWNWKKF